MARGFTLSTIFSAIDRITGPSKTIFGKVQGHAKQTTNALASVGRIAGGILASRAIVAGIRQLRELGRTGIDLASDLTEVQNVVDTTFGQNAGQINDWSRAAMSAFGLSELQAKKFNGTMGAMLKSSGLTSDQMLEMSKGLTGLSGDFASFYNLDHEEAFTKIQSGISGEIEPLRRIGINMSVANMEAFALAKGLRRPWREMSQAQQTILRYQYLMEKSADAQGDFAKTLETSYANQKRVLQTNFMQVVANAIRPVLPLMTEGLQKVNAFVSRIGDWVMANQELIKQRAQDIFRRIASAADRAFPILEKVWRAFQWMLGHIPELTALYFGFQAAIWAVNAAMSANPVGAVVASIMALIAATILIIRYWNQITAVLRKVWNAINNVFNNPVLRIAMSTFAAPLQMILGTIQAIVDLLSGRNVWESLANITGPWKGILDAVGITRGSGGWNEPGQADQVPVSPNASVIESRHTDRWEGEVNFRNAPAGMSVRTTGKAPKFNLDMGKAFGRGQAYQMAGAR